MKTTTLKYMTIYVVRTSLSYIEGLIPTVSRESTNQSITAEAKESLKNPDKSAKASHEKPVQDSLKLPDRI
ncbi:hypothetical protein GIB67_013424 [Kingdonia uniflora]|uniref:Uncharacterized protein n=1 Tax=Kingdonia uniflora TaxID=39325 RepID=A0A7J7LQZ5_9MAGN|nr:hypothetical protein GIB67_013424 [Kingdonia uniflora]